MASKVTPQEIKAYYEAWREVYADRRLWNGADMSILMAIKDTGFDNMFMTQQHIGELVGANRATANRALKNIEACGYIIGNHPPKGTKKAVTYKLATRLVAPTKYIVFMSATPDTKKPVMYKSAYMNMYKSAYMKKKEIEPVMYKSAYTIDINGNNINGFAKTPNTHTKNGIEVIDMTPPRKLPHITPSLSVEEVKKALLERGVVATKKEISLEEERCRIHYGKQINEGKLTSWLINEKNYKGKVRGVLGGMIREI